MDAKTINCLNEIKYEKQEIEKAKAIIDRSNDFINRQEKLLCELVKKEDLINAKDVLKKNLKKGMYVFSLIDSKYYISKIIEHNSYAEGKYAITIAPSIENRSIFYEEDLYVLKVELI